MTSNQTGAKWISELLEGHPDRIHDAFRMSKRIFTDLLRKLEVDHELQGSRRTSSREILGITLYILAQRGSFRLTKERFQHSTETISRYFSKGIRSLPLLSIDIIKPIDRQFRDIPAEIRYDSRYMPFFKDCVGAIDGTHVDARIPVEDQVRYIGRHGTTTQNVMAVCDFNMCFTFALAGWEGTAHDRRMATRTKGSFPTTAGGHGGGKRKRRKNSGSRKKGRRRRKRGQGGVALL
ncbi:hypothetical protein KSP39_PZI022934 [Platanthera zijinensis]|uniref:DDE Tnp4 domain-containing protein n=1 Tax=Platanthera zijinensis TaxID=2320716 RepID=A0AAP0AV07_9ASPA